jgi:hypothetical protein
LPEGKETIKKEAPGTKLAEIEEKIKVLRRKRTQARSQGESSKYDREIAELEKQKQKK